jgi:hypothetical protein
MNVEDIIAGEYDGDDGSNGSLRALLDQTRAHAKCSMEALTVLDKKVDPFRQDTPAGHRDGGWLASLVARLPADRTIHCRGLHYVAIGQIKPDGEKYQNAERDWNWLQNGPAKSARWLRYVPFDRITDERNSPPVIRRFEPPKPRPYITVGGVEVIVPDEIAPDVKLDDFRAVQPFKVAIFGEKTSLEPVLGPIADYYGADLFLPTGEASDTMIHELAKLGAEDGRRLVVFYLSDCDPAGWQMGVSVSRKLQAFKAGFYPDLDFELRPVALTPDQVREHDLPSEPMKDTESRADRWFEAFGVYQTEIDSIATLQPELLNEIVRDAIRPFFDTGLDRRVREARHEWEERARESLIDAIGPEQLEQLRADAEEKLASLEDEIAALNDGLQIDELYGVDLPEPPEIPEAQLNGRGGLPHPLIDSDWSFLDQTRRLIAHKRYEDGGDE